MTEQEAIKNINALNAVCGQKDFYDEEFVEALKMGVDALKKQIAKKPVKKSFIIPCDGIWVCPSCKEPLGGKLHHCECGQKLDWSEV
jgi:hypothetical protein